MYISIETYIIAVILIIIGILITIKIQLPKRLKQEYEQWEAEAKNKKVIKQHEDREELKIKQAVKEERKEIFEKNRKVRARQHYIDTAKKGKDYELYIADYFSKQGYKTKNHGLIHGRRDKGIDVIIKKDKEYTTPTCQDNFL